MTYDIVMKVYICDLIVYAKRNHHYNDIETTQKRHTNDIKGMGKGV